MSFEGFPPLPVRKDPPYVLALDDGQRELNERMRRSTIETQRQNTLSILETIPEFDAVPTESKEYLAERVARAIRAAQEGGFQEAIDLYGAASRDTRRGSTGIYADGLPLADSPTIFN